MDYRITKNELLKYQHITDPKAGGQYLLVMGCLKGKDPAQRLDADFALRAKNCRDGLEATLFNEATLRAKKTDRDLYWTLNDEGDGKISLWSETTKKYLNMDGQGARLSKRKQILTVIKDGDLVQITADADGEKYYLRASGHSESPYGLIFTSGRASVSVSFAWAERIRGISAKPEGKPWLTVGTMADIHVDYGLQLFRPYLRRSALVGANTYRRRYDLDAMITCGDNISDNGSGGYRYGGAMQGKWPEERFRKTQKRLSDTLCKAFRDPDKAQNVFWITGNHDTQIGDRQPEGKRFNSGDYSAFLPPCTDQLWTDAGPVDVGPTRHLLCYECRVKGVPFLMLNTPRYPFDPRHKFPDRYAPAHTMEQADWLEGRLKAIEEAQGKNALVFVVSHYPMWSGSFATEGPDCPENRNVFLRMREILNRYPNLFYFYGHVHGGCNDRWVHLKETGENTEAFSNVELWQNENGTIAAKDSEARGIFRSGLMTGTGCHHEYAGSMAYFKSMYFANDGKNINTWLSEVEVPFFQGCAIEVYEDRVVLTMENLGTKADLAKHVPHASYQLKPLVQPLKK